MNQAEIIDEIKRSSIEKFQENEEKIMACLKDYQEDEIWRRPNPSSNSVGNQILHLCGNITQYVISSLGEVEDVRERDKEFQADGGYTKGQLLGKLTDTLQLASSVIKNLDPDKFLDVRSVQGYQLTAVGIIMHVTEHFSYHTGQIIFWTKLLRDKDLGFYAHVDLNKKNEHS